jgi:hypothetical protein
LRWVKPGRSQIHAQLTQPRGRQTTTGTPAFVKNGYLRSKAMQSFSHQRTGKPRTYNCHPFSLLHRPMLLDVLQNFSYYAILVA